MLNHAKDNIMFFVCFSGFFYRGVYLGMSTLVLLPAILLYRMISIFS